MARKTTIPLWVWIGIATVLVAVVVVSSMAGGPLANMACPGSQVYCPGVGCVSGQDKCFPGARGGASAVFSKETFAQWPGVGVRASPPIYEQVKETFVSKKCPDGTRTDGPCLMEF